MSDKGYAYVRKVVISGAAPGDGNDAPRVEFDVEVFAGDPNAATVIFDEPITKLRPHALRRIVSSLTMGRRAYRVARNATEAK